MDEPLPAAPPGLPAAPAPTLDMNLLPGMDSQYSPQLTVHTTALTPSNVSLNSRYAEGGFTPVAKTTTTASSASSAEVAIQDEAEVAPLPPVPFDFKDDAAFFNLEDGDELDLQDDDVADSIDDHMPPPPHENFTYTMKIVLGFFQIVTNLGTGLQLRWPTHFRNFLKYFDVFNADFILGNVVNAECYGASTYYFKFIMITLAPPIVLLCITLFYLVPRWFGCCDKQITGPTRPSVWMKYVLMCLYVLFLLYPGVSSTVLRHYICKDIDGDLWLYADLRQPCQTATWDAYAAVDVFLVLLYPVGIPLGFFYLLWRCRHTRNSHETMAKVGFLYAGYKREYWYFEMVDMAHKIMMTSGLAFLPKDLQIPGGLCIACLYMIYILMTTPYVRQRDDFMHVLIQAEIMIFLHAGNVFAGYEDVFNARDDFLISAVLIGLTLFVVACILYFVCMLLIFLRTDYIERKEVQLRVSGEFWATVRRQQRNRKAVQPAE